MLFAWINCHGGYISYNKSGTPHRKFVIEERGSSPALPPPQMQEEMKLSPEGVPVPPPTEGSALERFFDPTHAALPARTLSPVNESEPSEDNCNATPESSDRMIEEVGSKTRIPSSGEEDKEADILEDSEPEGDEASSRIVPPERSVYNMMGQKQATLSHVFINTHF